MEDDVVFAIAIEISGRGVVGLVAVGCLERDGEIGLRRRRVGGEREGLAGGSFGAADDGTDGIRCRLSPP
jgi:hypothetical protein